MPEEATTAPAEVRDTPTPAETPQATDTSPASPEADSFEKRYNDLRPHADRASQEAAEYRQKVEAYEALHSGDPDLQAQAAEFLGIDLGNDEATEEYDDPFASIEKRLEALQSKLDAKEQAEKASAQERSILDSVEGQIDALEKAEGMSLDDETIELLCATAMAASPTDQGVPDIPSAWKKLNGWVSTEATRMAARKRASTAPVGEPGDRKFDFNDRGARHNATVAAIERHMNSQ